VERSLREIVLSGNNRRPDAAGRSALAGLYDMNPGGLRQYGLSLPIAVVSAGDVPPRVIRRIKSLLRRHGYRISDVRQGGPDLSVLRVVGEDSNQLKWFMEDPRGRIRSSAESHANTRRAYLAPVLAGVLDGFYRTDLYGAQL
jgi:hypothetical protein